MRTLPTRLLAIAGGVGLLSLTVVFLLWPPARDALLVDPEEGRPPAHYEGLAGSSSCRPCHQRFFELWAPSHHGLAMQPFTEEFARTQITPHGEEIQIGGHGYRADIEGARVVEQGPDGEKEYSIEHVLGGKNVYYFLTPLERGRLQVLPIAYDVRKREWFDTTLSMVRHFTNPADEALDWRERPLTFNTSCYGCHVSQLSTNYDLTTDSYHSAWAEPGINCETCHGPCAEHVRVCTEAPEGDVPEDLKVIRATKFSVEQRNALCAPCHAKMRPLTASVAPGERFFDHFDLVTLEDPDFYPDGRDLGENYTYTHWRMSPCARSGRLDCLHCHTSSGRYRFHGSETNRACLPCHREHVENADTHSHHPAESAGSHCVSCHMPMTMFSRMARSDHSMRPPTPATTIAYESPNACNLCHGDQDAAWADGWVRKWRTRDYQAPVLHRAGLVDAARKGDWSRLPELLRYITTPERDEVYATSLIRLLESCASPEKWPVLLEASRDPSPLVRSAAVAGLGAHATARARDALLAATEDEYRLVRLRAAMSLTRLPESLFTPDQRLRLSRVFEAYEASLRIRLDQWASHYNLGNYYFHRGELRRALTSFETAMRLEPNTVAPLVNAAFAYNLVGNRAKAEASLRRASRLEPANGAIHLNLGLLLAEYGEMRGAETALRAALRAEPGSAVAAYNLGVLLSSTDRVAEGIEWCRKASELSPEEAKYGYTYAFFLLESGDFLGARTKLEGLIERHPGYADAYLLLGASHEREHRMDEAASVYRQALEVEYLPERDRFRIAARLEALRSP